MNKVRMKKLNLKELFKFIFVILILLFILYFVVQIFESVNVIEPDNIVPVTEIILSESQIIF